jgi:uncharacterized protein YcbK (DUF882 family)
VTHVSGLPALPALSHSSARESRSDDDEAKSSFASALAGAAHAQTRPTHAPPKNEGTSELDAPEDTSDETGDAGDTKDARDATDAGASKAAIAHGDPASSDIDRSVAALDPALQERLARVMARMREETGHDVQIGETYRSQSRQNELFARGRSTPGPVVTWTQNSKHTQGRAVDLLVDNGAAGAGAYAALRRIATEEGLRTLGARDPGHLELPATPSEVTAAAQTEVGTLRPSLVAIARVAQLAPTARVAEVKTARPAEVASVASVNRIANASASASSAMTATPIAVTNTVMSTVSSENVKAALAATPATETAAKSGTATSSSVDVTSTMGKPVANVASQQASAQNETNAGHQRFGGNSDERGKRSGGERDAGAYVASVGMGKHATAQFPVADVAPTTGAAAAQRVAQVIATREDAPATPLSQIVMSVDTGLGTTDRIQVGLRGNAVNATIDAADPRAAHAMTARSDELVRALTRDGMDVESLRVRAAATVAPTIATDTSQRSSDSSTSSRFERGAQWQEQHNRQRADDERRQQQRDERGGKES